MSAVSQAGSRWLTEIGTVVAGPVAAADPEVVADPRSPDPGCLSFPCIPSPRPRSGRAPAPMSRHTDGSGYADVYLHGPCTGR